MLVKIKETKKLKTEAFMLGISAGKTQSEMFPLKDDDGDWERYNEYSIVSENICCEEMQTSTNYDFVTFSSEIGKYCFDIPKYDSDGDYIGTNDLPLKCCPFCGEELKYEIVERAVEQPIIQDYSYKTKEIVKEPVYKDITVTRKKYVGCIEERLG